MEIADNTGVTIPPMVVPMFAVACGVKSTIVKGNIPVNKTTLHNDIMAVTSKNKTREGSDFSGLVISLIYYFRSSFLLQILLPSMLIINLMFLIIQQAIVKSPPSAVDSLKASLNQMQMKIDSLEKVVLKTEIAEGFFSDALSTNLYCFSTIIGFAALISWASIAGMLYLHKKTVRKEALQSIRQHRDETLETSERIKKEIIETKYNVNRAMYFAIGDISHEARFLWGFSTVMSIIDQDESNPDLNLIYTWMNGLTLHLKKSSSPEELKKNRTRYDDGIKRLRSLNDEKLNGIVSDLEDRLYQIMYSQDKKDSSPPTTD